MQNLNLRLTLAVYAMAIAVFVVMVITLRIVYFDAATQQQATSLKQLQNFVNHPDYDQALTAMPEDLATSFTRAHEQLTNTAAYLVAPHKIVELKRRWVLG